MTIDAKEEKVSKEESASATDLVLAIVKTSNALRMYLPNNPLLQKFHDELRGKMTGHLERYGELRLDIDHFEMKYKDNSVYENHDPKESLAFKMYSDGIKSLIFSEGIEGKEIDDLLEILGKDSTGGMDDDMVTLLWEKELPHITYTLNEDHLEFDAGSAGSTVAAIQAEVIKEVYNAMPHTLTAAPMVIPQNIVTLSERESDWLKNAIEREEKRNPAEAVIGILSSILSVEKDAAAFGRFINIAVNMTGNLIHSGDIGYAMSLITFLKELSGNENLPPYHLEKVKKAMDGAVSIEIINDLEKIIDTSDKITAKGLSDLLFFFGRTSIKQVFELLEAVRKKEMKKVIFDSLVIMGKDAPDAFFPFLTDGRCHAVKDAVHILRMTGSPSAIEPVSRLIQHGEPGIRKEALLYLAATPETKAKNHIIKFLQDKESSIRMGALNALAGSGFRDALDPVMNIATSKEFDKRDMSEKKAVFEALGGLGSDQVVPMLREMLLKRYWFKKEREKEQTFLAVSGLRKVKTELAIKTLEEGEAKKRGKIRDIVTQALKGIQMERKGK